ncbi:MAG: GNAT family N-acetyltransferase [Lachnospiraceae bacterium]|nr:GNAT family N-acetyltransferase [Lachnospiraceae bacterium]
MKIGRLKPEYDLALADLIRVNLKNHSLDIPGTVYFDENLNHLSDYYLSEPDRRYYYVVTDDNDKLIGGIGLAEFGFFEDCCELQKLYLDDRVKGAGLSYKLISLIEDKAKELGYKYMYLETHDNLAAAIHVYEKAGYREIEKPEGVVHATMNRFFIKDI